MAAVASSGTPSGGQLRTHSRAVKPGADRRHPQTSHAATPPPSPLSLCRFASPSRAGTGNSVTPDTLHCFLTLHAYPPPPLAPGWRGHGAVPLRGGPPPPHAKAHRIPTGGGGLQPRMHLLRHSIIQVGRCARARRAVLDLPGDGSGWDLSGGSSGALGGLRKHALNHARAVDGLHVAGYGLGRCVASTIGQD